MKSYYLENIGEKELAELLELARHQKVMVRVNSAGGNLQDALRFVESVKEESLESNLEFDIANSGSAASFILLSLDGSRRVLRDGAEFVVHGGTINAEVPEVEFLLATAKRCLHMLYRQLDGVVEPSRLDTFSAKNTLDLTKEECRLAGFETT